MNKYQQLFDTIKQCLKLQDSKLPNDIYFQTLYNLYFVASGARMMFFDDNIERNQLNQFVITCLTENIDSLRYHSKQKIYYNPTLLPDAKLLDNIDEVRLGQYLGFTCPRLLGSNKDQDKYIMQLILIDAASASGTLDKGSQDSAAGTEIHITAQVCLDDKTYDKFQSIAKKYNFYLKMLDTNLVAISKLIFAPSEGHVLEVVSSFAKFLARPSRAGRTERYIGKSSNSKLSDSSLSASPAEAAAASARAGAIAAARFEQLYNEFNQVREAFIEMAENIGFMQIAEIVSKNDIQLDIKFADIYAMVAMWSTSIETVAANYYPFRGDESSNYNKLIAGVEQSFIDKFAPFYGVLRVSR